MRCETNGLAVQDGEEIEGLVSLAYGDAFRCESCGAGVVVGFGEAMLTDAPPRERVVCR